MCEGCSFDVRYSEWPLRNGDHKDGLFCSFEIGLVFTNFSCQKLLIYIFPFGSLVLTKDLVMVLSINPGF